MASGDEQKQADQPPQETLEPSEWQQQLQKEVGYEGKSELAQTAIDAGVQSVAKWALQFSELISPDAVKSIEAMVASIDKVLEEHVNRILHHEKFQKLEGTWRGLYHLVNNTQQDETLKIKVFNISKKDLSQTLKSFKGARWDRSPLFDKIYTQEYSMWGGEPYGCIIGDYYFDQSSPDVEMLGEIAKIAAAAHAPFIAAASPTTMIMESWQELNEPDQLADGFQGPDFAKWRSLRDDPDACYVGLTMPRFLARLPYDPKENPVDEFAFQEDCDGTDHRSYTWSNAAYAMGVNINSAFKEYGWCSRIRGIEAGGLISDLPVHSFPTPDGGVDMKCPTEIAIDDRREKELADLGFMPVLHRKNSDLAAFIGAQSLQKPKDFGTRNEKAKEATASANLTARLPYLFAVSRFAHYLKAIVRDKIGVYTSRDELQKDLQSWINDYVEPKVDATQIQKAKSPLSEARVDVREVEGNPGYYEAHFFLRPHYQLEGVDVTLTLVSKLPEVGG